MTRPPLPDVLAPEPILRAALRVMFVASYTTRTWTLAEAVSRKQINDLWEALHNVPDLICHWREGAERDLFSMFDEYDSRWPQPRLGENYDRVLAEASRGGSEDER